MKSLKEILAGEPEGSKSDMVTDPSVNITIKYLNKLCPIRAWSTYMRP